jgi:ABC-type xylose transport system permease subunit
MGSLFGAIFGIIDVEDYYKNSFVLYTVLTKEISMCEPIGLIFGAFTGFMIEFLR